MNDRDREMLDWVRSSTPTTSTPRAHERPDVATLKPYYQDLIAEYFPATVKW